jgi:signal transduction histidine kinase
MERERVSRELHDGLGQVLNAIKFNIDSVGEGDLYSVKERITSLINDAVLESKRISENLLPLKLLDFDLVTCIGSLCNQSNSDKVEVIFQTQSFDNIHLDSQKLMLYRITQEALSNAIKHAGCSKIYVQLYHSGDYLNLSIEDNGKGFNKDMLVNKGQGLKNIKYRVEVLKGKLEIESSERVGTLVNINIPVKQTGL